MVRGSVRLYGLRPTRDNLDRVEIACGMQGPEKMYYPHSNSAKVTAS